MKYGFLSANIGGSGRSLYNVQVGNTVFSHIAGSGFVGIGECLATAVPMMEFTVDVNGIQTPITQAPWNSEDAKAMLDQNKEMWLSFLLSLICLDIGGFWETKPNSDPN